MSLRNPRSGGEFLSGSSFILTGIGYSSVGEQLTLDPDEVLVLRRHEKASALGLIAILREHGDLLDGENRVPLFRVEQLRHADVRARHMRKEILEGFLEIILHPNVEDSRLHNISLLVLFAIV